MELGKYLWKLKNNVIKGKQEDEDDLANTLLVKMDEAQEAIYTTVARVLDINGDIINNTNDNVYKNLRQLINNHKDLQKLINPSTKHLEKKWDENSLI